jgi:hypothetical protein
VRHLILDADGDFAEAPVGPSPDADDSGDPVAERMIGLALSTSAEVTPLAGEAASGLSRHDGVAAMLRY